MKNILLLFTLFILSCTSNQEVIIDNCQYIETTSHTGNGPVVSLTHKGNCNNSIHNNKMDSIIIDEENQ